MPRLACLGATCAEQEALGDSCGDCQAFWMRASRALPNGYGRVFFAARKAESGNRGYTILHGFCDYNRSLKVKASANDYLRTPGSFPRKKLEQLQQLVRGRFQKERAASNATEKNIWIPIDNKGDRTTTGKTTKKEGQDTHPCPACSLDMWKKRTMCGQRDAMQHWTCDLDGYFLSCALITLSTI